MTLITRLKDGLKKKDILIIHENNSITGSNSGEIQIVEDIDTEITDYIYNNNHQLVEKNTTNYTFSMKKKGEVNRKNQPKKKILKQNLNIILITN